MVDLPDPSPIRVHNRLEQLEERTQDANVIDAHQAWGPLVVALDQLADEAKSIYDEVLTTSSNAAASNRTGRYRHTGEHRPIYTVTHNVPLSATHFPVSLTPHIKFHPRPPFPDCGPTVVGTGSVNFTDTSRSPA
ncbi:hypothetical protein NM688_g8016 [Phlebia brevispora]|uniref:Uncharacterized protein n=1 Tax=Phlebia brevispora TaxID=194682 RepID=A0ACC1RYI7_9APHY|nr:hypothetical protein NM688_g8016 [Phlebia brevispora]